MEPKNERNEGERASEFNSASFGQLLPEAAIGDTTDKLQEANHPVTRFRKALGMANNVIEQERIDVNTLYDVKAPQTPISGGTSSESSGTTSSSGNKPHRLFGRRELLIGAAVAAAGATGAAVDAKTGLVRKAIKGFFGGSGDKKNVISPTGTLESEDTETSKPKETVTPEPTKSSEETPVMLEKITKLPVDLGEEMGDVVSYGNDVYHATTKSLQERTKCASRGGELATEACTSMQGIEYNLKDFPNAPELERKAVDIAMYKAWKKQHQDQSSTTFDQFMVRKNKENLTFKVPTGQDANGIFIEKEINVNAPVIFQNISEKEDARVGVTTAIQLDTDVVGGALVVKVYDMDAGGLKLGSAVRNLIKWGIARNIAYPLVLLQYPEINKKGSFSGESAKIKEDYLELTDVLIPEKDNRDIGYATTLNSIYRPY